MSVIDFRYLSISTENITQSVLNTIHVLSRNYLSEFYCHTKSYSKYSSL